MIRHSKITFAAYRSKLIIVVVAILACFGNADLYANVTEVQVEGLPDDRFNYAEFALWLPDGAPPSRILALMECGLGLANDTDWKRLATSLKCGLLVCYYDRAISDPWGAQDGGAGRALFKGLEELAKATHDPQLSKVNLFLVGPSGGGVLSYQIAALYSDRILGFVSLKGGHHNVSLAPNLARIPGLFVMGQLDMPFRLVNLKDTFAAGRKLGALWCLAMEPNSHHEPNKCTPLIEAFLLAINDTAQKLHDLRPAALSLDTGPTGANSVESWYPTTTFKRQCDAFQATGTIPGLPVFGFDSPTPAPVATTDTPRIELDAVQANAQSAITTFAVLPTDPPSWDGLQILPRSYLSNVVVRKNPQHQFVVSFKFRSKNLPLGWVSDSLCVRFTRHGERVLGGLTIPLSALIAGDFQSSPPSIYLGEVQPGVKFTATIKITSLTSSPIQLLSAEKPAEVTMDTSLQPSNPLSLRLTFDFGPADSNSGVILLHLKSKKDQLLRIPYIGMATDNS